MKLGSSRDLVLEEARGEVHLEAQDGHDKVVCRVSRDALEGLVSREELSAGDLLRVAHNYFELLTEKWANRLALGVCEIDGSVLLRRSDMIPQKKSTNIRLGSLGAAP